MAVEIEGLEFQIEAKSENAAKGVDALINSFNKLKAATKGGAGLNYQQETGRNQQCKAEYVRD